ncbi:hypothetical protein Nepgr_022946 [Nepenthes gracilis]|uniref:Uncharacterized protein n=1 Tax=Nepenthes gracilis TaxID=150966 RepID=A0AAD3XYK3_NEPGR|nr:hypothetical protein Nepgr_022946 [Nepenthes gracilis]
MLQYQKPAAPSSAIENSTTTLNNPTASSSIAQFQCSKRLNHYGHSQMAANQHRQTDSNTGNVKCCPNNAAHRSSKTNQQISQKSTELDAERHPSPADKYSRLLFTANSEPNSG